MGVTCPDACPYRSHCNLHVGHGADQAAGKDTESLCMVLAACRSADVYEFSTETLFFGRQDAMQVCVLTLAIGALTCKGC